jgi:protein SCO1
MSHSRGGVTWSSVILVIMMALTSLGFGFQFGSTKNSTNLISTQIATVLPKPQEIIDFNLTDNLKHSFTKKNLLGHWTLMYFGFTSCPQICPTTMVELNKVYKKLAKNGLKEPEVLLVSIDPQRDTPARINNYVTSFNPQFKGATGSEAELTKLTNDLNVLYLKIQTKTNAASGSYDIDHSGNIMVINPQGQLAAFFSMPHNAKYIAADMTKIMAG